MHVFFGLAKEAELNPPISRAGAVTTSDLPPGRIHYSRLAARHLVMSKYHLWGPPTEGEGSVPWMKICHLSTALVLNLGRSLVMTSLLR